MHALRAIGAALGYITVVVGLAYIVQFALQFALPPPWNARFGEVTSTSVLVVLSALAVNTAMVARGWAKWGQLGWPDLKTGTRGWGIGFGIGVVMAAGAIALAVVVGHARVSLTGDPFGAYVPAAARVGGLLVVAALAEELLFRGYPLARVAAAVGKVPASVGLAGAFALVHVFNPNLSILGLVNIGWASLVLSAAFFTPGALPAAWGLHLGWNGGLSLGADAPVSGIGFNLPALDFATGGPAWVTGGAFGPEGGLVATVVMVAALVWLARIVARRREVDTQ